MSSKARRIIVPVCVAVFLAVVQFTSRQHTLGGTAFFEAASSETQYEKVCHQTQQDQIGDDGAYERGKQLARANRYEEAICFFLFAAEQGNAAAMNDLGTTYRNMDRPNNERAMYWYRRSSDLGLATGMSAKCIGMVWAFRKIRTKRCAGSGRRLASERVEPRIT